MSTVPMLAPDGTPGDVPQSRVNDAVKAGFKIAAELTSPDGKQGLVPIHRVHDAINAGFMLQGAPIRSPIPEHQPGQPNLTPMIQQNEAQAAVAGLPGGSPITAPATPLMAGVAGAGIGAAGAAVYGPAALVAAGGMAKTALKTAPYIAASEAINYARGHLPGGRFIPPGAELLPFFMGGGKGETAAAEEEAAATKLGPEAPSKELLQGNRGMGGAVKANPADALDRAYTPASTPEPKPIFSKEKLGPEPQPTGTPLISKTRLGPEPAPPGPPPVFSKTKLGPDAPPPEVGKSKGLGGWNPPEPPAAALAKLKAPTKDIVNAAIPAENKALNSMAHSQVDFYLKKGDVAGAEKALDTAAAKVNPEWPPERPPYAGDTNTIRANLPENVAKRRADLLDDQGIQQQMSQNLEQHGLSAESEARREFIARNSTGATKGDLIREAGGTVPDKPVRYTKTVEPKAKPAPPPPDLTALLEESVRQAKLRKQAGGR